MSLHREPTYRHLNYVFAWRGIKIFYIFLVAVAGLTASLIVIFPQWAMAWLADFVGEPLGPLGTFFFVTLRPPWWSVPMATVGVAVGVGIYQWRRDPNLLGRKIVARSQPRKLSPLMVDRRDSPQWLNLQGPR